ncbi:glucuronate isomerase [Bacillus velezensis]
MNEKTAAAIWKKTNELLQGDGFGARDLILKSNVKVICTTDDPADALTYHQLLKESDFPVQVVARISA